MTHILLIPHNQSLLEQGENGERPPKAWLGQDGIWRIFNAWKENAPPGPEALILARNGEVVPTCAGWLPPSIADRCLVAANLHLEGDDGHLDELTTLLGGTGKVVALKPRRLIFC